MIGSPSTPGSSRRLAPGLVVLALAALATLASHAGDALAKDHGRRPRVAIDIGSSGIKMLVTDKRGRVVRDQKFGASLGRNVGRDRLLPKENVARARAALEKLADHARKLGVEADDIVVVATAAVRAADGAPIAGVSQEGSMTGRAFISDVVRGDLRLVRARILSGVTEAKLGFRGALRASSGAATQPVVVIDTGGGSHQVVLGTGRRIVALGSTPIGSNYVREKILVDAAGEQLDVITPAELAAADARLAAAVPALPIDAAQAEGAQLVATGGVAKFLAIYFRTPTIGRAQLAELRAKIASIPEAKRKGLAKFDIEGKEFSRDEKRRVGLYERGEDSYGKKLPAKLSLVLHLMKLLGSESIALSQTDVRHLLTDAR